MKKYYIGILVIALFTLGLTGFVLFQAASTKQDTETSRKGQQIADKLNSYVSNKGVPQSLAEANIKDVPASITYTKKSSDTYEFCVTYKHASDGFSEGGFSQILTGALQSSQAYNYPTDDYGSDYTPSSLYLPYSHKAGQDCQTIKPYVYDNYYNYNNTDPTYPSINQGDYDLGSGAALGSTASDSERQADINVLHGQVEVYYAVNGYYPTLANINESAWRKTNMKGLDEEALRDPKGTSYTLTATPVKSSYSYVVVSDTGKPCDNSTVDCTIYTLTATLDGGSIYSKHSLN